MAILAGSCASFWCAYRAFFLRAPDNDKTRRTPSPRLTTYHTPCNASTTTTPAVKTPDLGPLSFQGPPCTSPSSSPTRRLPLTFLVRPLKSPRLACSPVALDSSTFVLPAPAACSPASAAPATSRPPPLRPPPSDAFVAGASLIARPTPFQLAMGQNNGKPVVFTDQGVSPSCCTRTSTLADRQFQSTSITSACCESSAKELSARFASSSGKTPA